MNIKKLLEDTKDKEKKVTPKVKEMIQRRTKIIINPPLKEDENRTIYDPYGVINDPEEDFSTKNLAYQIIRKRMGND